MSIRTGTVVGIAAILLLLAFVKDANAQGRTWTDLNGKAFQARYVRIGSGAIRLERGVGAHRTQGSFPVNAFSTNDLIWVYEQEARTTAGVIDHTSEQAKKAGGYLAPVFQERLQEHVNKMQWEEVRVALESLPFMKNWTGGVILKRLETMNLAEINETAVSFPAIRNGILMTLRKRLASPTDEFFAIGTMPDFGNHNPYMEKKLAAYREIASKYPEVKKSVIGALSIELRDPTKNRYWNDLKILSDLKAAFPEVRTDTTNALLQSILNPANMEAKQYRVFYDSYGMRFSEDQVMDYHGRWVTKRGRHPVTPREEPRVDIFDRRKAETIATQSPEVKIELESVIARELENTARRWSWNELRELAVSFPNVQEQIEAVVAQDLNSPKSQYANISREEILDAFPNLEEVVQARVSAEFNDPRKRFSPTQLIERVQKFPGSEADAEARLRAQMMDSKYNRDYENLDLIDEIVSAFPNLEDCAAVALGRTVMNPLRSGNTGDGKPDRKLVQLVGTRFPASMTGCVVEALEDAVNNTTLRWTNEELVELVTSFPELEPTVAKKVARDLQNSTKEFSVKELLRTARQFPSIKDYCSPLVLEHLQNPRTKAKLDELLEIAWRFPAIKEDLLPLIERAVDRMVDSRYHDEYEDYWYRFNGKMIEYFCALMKDAEAQGQPEVRDLVQQVIYRRIERIVDNSDPTSLREWIRTFKPPYDKTVAASLKRKKVEFEDPDEVNIPSRLQNAGVKEVSELIASYPTQEARIREYEQLHFVSIANMSSREGLERWIAETGYVDPLLDDGEMTSDEERIRNALVENGIVFPERELSALRRATELALKLSKEHKPYILGYCAALAFLFLLMCFMKPRWVWGYLLGFALVLPAPIILYIWYRRVKAWRQHRRAQHEEYLAAGGKTMKQKLVDKAIATKTVAQNKANAAAGAVSQGIHTAKEQTVQAGSAVASATSQATSVAREKAREFKAKAEDIAHRNLTKKSAEETNSLNSNPGLPEAVVPVGEKLPKSANGKKKHEDEPSSGNVESA